MSVNDQPSDTPLPLADEDLRHGIELLFFAYRDFTSDADAILAEQGFGRAHHRVIHFVGRHPQISVAELLAILRITKQSLGRVLGQLVDQGFIAQATGTRDRRQRHHPPRHAHAARGTRNPPRRDQGTRHRRRCVFT